MTCRSCGAPIRWVRTANGRAMPLDADAVADGNVELVGGVAHVRGPAYGWPEGTLRWQSHFAVCPGGGTWRRKR